ncbi:MAG: hypothetical protein ABSC32_20430 [Steroidobacteraceae bacterium]|jgi:hypothetical protein
MRPLTIAAASLMLAAPLAAHAQQNSVAADPCARYQWDVAPERALFAAAASPITAAKNGGAPPRIATNRAYRVQLAPAGQVEFPAAPGQASPAEGNYSGILALTVPASGSYRVAVDQAMWIDVVADMRLVPPTDYEAEHGCEAPRKIVQFSLEARKPLILQLSGTGQPAITITIVRASGD